MSASSLRYILFQLSNKQIFISNINLKLFFIWKNWVLIF